MAQFEPHVIHHSDAATPHYSVQFLGDGGESVTVECRVSGGDGDPGREAVIEAAYEIVSRLAREAPNEQPSRAPTETVASTGGGLSRPIEQTEEQTHTSEGLDRGTA